MLFKKIVSCTLIMIIMVFLTVSLCQAKRLRPEKLIYKGAFRLPNEYNNSYQWEYGGVALAFRPDGDFGGENDGYPGSLFSAGKRQGANILRDISEFSIPKPVNSTFLGDMNEASTIQTFNDITEGLFDQALAGQQLNEFRGLAYLDALPGQSSGKMYWSIWSAYNTADKNLPSQGYSDLIIESPNAQGVWKIAGYNSKYVSGYLFDIPKKWADNHIEGKYLATGISRSGGAFSRGPAMFAIAPYRYSRANPPLNNELPTIPLIFYNDDYDNYPNYSENDQWRGGSWVTSGDEEAVLFVGLKCIGSTCYGTGDHCADPCSSYKGYHCYPKEPQMIFYDVSDLEAVASGNKKPWEPLPYHIINLTTVIPHYSSCSDSQGLSYDRDNGILYLIQKGGDSSKPLVHVFRVEATADDGNGTTPGALSISTNSLADGIIDENYQTSLTANGGVPPYTWTIESGSLPVDLSLSSSGGISGVPLFDGTNSFTVKVTDSDSPNSTAIKNFNITVNIFSTLSILTTTLSSAFIDDAYNESIVAEGGVSPYTWRLAGGALPQGLSLSSAGILSGIPIMETSSSFTVEVVDNSGSVKTKQFTLSVSGSSSDTDMIGYWALDEGSGVDALDTAGRTNTLKINGSSWTIGRLGAALNFNGASNYAYRSDSSLSGAFPAKSVGAAKDFTLAAWIFLDKINSRQPIVSKQGNGNRGFLFLVEDSNKLSLQLFNNSDIRTEIFSSSTFDAGQWYHVAATYDYVGDGNSSLILYINGVKDASTDSAVGPVRGNNEAFELGRYYWGGGYSRYMDGSIDDVQLYQRALSAEEIAAIVFGNEDSAPAEVPGAPTNLEVIMD